MTRHEGGGPPRLRFVAPNGRRPAGERVLLEVDDEHDAGRAVLQARAGRDLEVVVTAEPRVLQALVEDLGRLGTIEVASDGEPGAIPADLEPDVAQLVRLLAAGATVSAAARTVGLSRRTATRRLAELREGLGVTTTAEAVMALIDRLDGTG